MVAGSGGQIKKSTTYRVGISKSTGRRLAGFHYNWRKGHPSLWLQGKQFEY